MKIVFFSVTGNVRRFVKDLADFSSLEITQTNPFIEVNQPFVFIAPAYEKEVTEIAWDFMETGSNAQNCRGIIGSGNLNFSDLYIYTAKDLARDFDIPLLDDFEAFGTAKERERIKEKIYACTESNQES